MESSCLLRSGHHLLKKLCPLSFMKQVAVHVPKTIYEHPSRDTSLHTTSLHTRHELLGADALRLYLDWLHATVTYQEIP